MPDTNGGLLHLMHSVGQLTGAVEALSRNVSVLQSEQGEIRRDLGQALDSLRREIKTDIADLSKEVVRQTSGASGEIRTVREKVIFVSGWIAAAGVFVAAAWALFLR